jgi:hypothetical protein
MVSPKYVQEHLDTSICCSDWRFVFMADFQNEQFVVFAY